MVIGVAGLRGCDGMDNVTYAEGPGNGSKAVPTQSDEPKHVFGQRGPQYVKQSIFLDSEGHRP